MALPKTVKYLLCYLPFILVGTGLVVFGVFQEDSARIASLIVGVVVLFSGLFAWCTDSDVGCFVVCSCWSNKERKLKKTSKSTTTNSRVIHESHEIFTIHNSRTAASPQTTASKKTTTKTPTNNDESNTVKDENFRETRMIQRDRHNQYGQYSLHSMHQHKVYDQDQEAALGAGGNRRQRFPTRAPSLDNHLNTYKPNGIHGRHEMRLTVRNLQKLDKIRQHHQSQETAEQHQRMPEINVYTSQQMNNEAFELEFSLSIQKRESIKNWITDVHHSREDVAVMHNDNHQPSHQWGVSAKGYDSSKFQRKPLPQEPPQDRFTGSTASGSAIDIEVHSLPRSFGSDGNKSPTGTLDRIDSPENRSPEYDLNGYIGKRMSFHFFVFIYILDPTFSFDVKEKTTLN